MNRFILLAILTWLAFHMAGCIILNPAYDPEDSATTGPSSGDTPNSTPKPDLPDNPTGEPMPDETTGTTSAGSGTTGDLPEDPECGNGIVDDGEDCDDGNADNNDGCTTECVVAECGDGYLTACDGKTCFAADQLGDGSCDEQLFCVEHQFDEGDCLATCEGSEEMTCKKFVEKYLPARDPMARCADGAEFTWATAAQLLRSYYSPLRFQTCPTEGDLGPICFFIPRPSGLGEACWGLDPTDPVTACELDQLLPFVPSPDAGYNVAYQVEGVESNLEIETGSPNNPLAGVGVCGIDEEHPLAAMTARVGKGTGDCTPALKAGVDPNPMSMLALGEGGSLADYKYLESGEVDFKFDPPLTESFQTILVGTAGELPNQWTCATPASSDGAKYVGGNTPNPDHKVGNK